MARHRRMGWAAWGTGIASAALLIGCGGDHHTSSGPTEIVFGEALNLGERCDSGLTSWTVVNRETTDQGTATCEQPIIFTNLTPNAAYTFDVTGYVGSRLCWQGSCGVTSIGYETVYADCSAEIVHLCGF